MDAIGVSVQELLGPLFCVVPNGGLGVSYALVQGKGGSVMSAIVHSVHSDGVPRMGNPVRFVWM